MKTLRMLSTSSLLEAGTQALTEQARVKEADKKGILRGGSIGLAEKTDKGIEVSGTCHRQAMLRFLGVDVKGMEDNTSRDLMFAAGRTNEDSWLEVLAASWPGKILREEEVPIVWNTPNGTVISGRPDMVLACSEGKYFARGLELKLVSSLWTARTVIKGEPKTNHLIQTAHYMWRLSEQVREEVPFELWYTSRVDWHVMGWAQKHFPKHGALNSEFCEYSQNKDGEYEIKKVLPFTKGFEVRFVQDKLQFKEVGGKKWVDTIITKSRIAMYYEHIEELAQSKSLGPRPVNLDYSGQKESWKQCDFCPLSKICDEYENDSFEVWLAQITKGSST